MEVATAICVGWAEAGDVAPAVDILMEAGRYMAARHRMLWDLDGLGADFVAPLIARGELAGARCGGELAGVCTLTRRDRLFWPEDAPGEAAYLHKLAVRRAFAGGGVTAAIFAFCAGAARTWGCRELKLDCDPTLGKVYLRAGFRRVDQRLIRPTGRAPFTVDRFALSLED